MKFNKTPIGTIPENWKISKVSDIAKTITDYVANGSFASLSENVTYKEKEDVAVLIRLVDYNNNFNGNFVFIDEHAYEFLKKSKLFGGEIIISNVGANVGTVFKCPKLKYKMSLAPNSIMVKFKGCDEFYYQWLKGHNGQQMLKSIVTGSAQPKFNKTNFKEMLVPVPPLETQKKIASILSALDDKIELNNKINENLEMQAQAIFKSWFVDFEPFGGVMPEDMREIPLNELCEIVTKGTTPTTIGKHFSNKGINFLKAESILQNHSFDRNKFAHIDNDTHTVLKRSIIKEGDIVFTIAGTLGRFALVDNTIIPANTNQAVAIIRANNNVVSSEYLYSFFIGNWHNEYYTKRVQQAVQANLSLTTIKSLPIFVLSNEDMMRYNGLVTPIFKAMKANEYENFRLSALRDTLLPKLMNGEIDVDDVQVKE